MMYYILLPFRVVLVVLQSAGRNSFSGLVTLELSLIVVIYAGFRLELWKGAALSLSWGWRGLPVRVPPGCYAVVCLHFPARLVCFLAD